MKKKIVNIAIILIFIAGLSLLLYPTISDYYNSLIHSKLIADYADKSDSLEEDAYKKELAAAEEYNRKLLYRENPFELTKALEQEYYSLLKLTDTDIIAYVEIPSLGVVLPICHGTEENTLEKAVGHVEWSSLPVGGESTHCVISGHRGLPSSELFTNLDRMNTGDIFYIHTLGKTLIYKTDNIVTVTPNDYTYLGITEGKDYVTLLTCTPYGVNSHRLLVRGVRVQSEDEEIEVFSQITNETKSVSLKYIVPLCLVALFIPTFIILIIPKKKKAKKGEAEIE